MLLLLLQELLLCQECLEGDDVPLLGGLRDGERTAQHSAHVGAGAGALPSNPHQAGLAGERRDVQQTALLHLLDLLLLLVLLSVGELHHQGTAAPLHGQTVVHGLDGQDGDLAVGEGYEGAAWTRE